MKIFVLPSWYKTKKNPETCIFIYEQVEGLARLGHQIIVISPQQSFIPLFWKSILVENDEFSNIIYRNYWVVWPSKMPYQNIRSFDKCAKKLTEKAIELFGVPDVIYAHFSTPAGFVATKIGDKYKIPVVVEEHLSDLMQQKWEPFRYDIVKDTINGARKFVCVSEGLKKNIEDNFGKHDNILVISNMINSCFQYQEVTSDHFVFLSIGSLIPRKGFEFLIKTFASVFKGKNVELRIAGKGYLKNKLEKLILENGLEEQVHLLGQLSREDTLKQYQNCNCFVLASQAETFGLVYREALAVGRPIISTRHGGFCESDWHDEFGYLVDFGDEKGMEDALSNIFNNYSEFNRKKISDLCLATCSSEVVLQTIANVLESVIQ